MVAKLIHTVSGLTIREIHNPIRYIFNHQRDVVYTMSVKALQHGGGLLIVQIGHDTTLHMPWASYTVMMDRILKSRAWRNHFSGYKLNRVVNGELKTYIIGA